jgi:hypothetical protein
MAIYRFRVSLEENDDIFRDIDIRSVQTFDLFHTAIQEAFKFDNKHSASFFVSDDYWRKNQEITLKKEDLPLEPEEIKKGLGPKKLMAEIKIAKYIEQPHQRFVYIFDPNAQWCFLIEMVKIAEENPKLNYPVCSRTVGTAPKQYKTLPVIKEEELDGDPLAKLLADIDVPDEEAYKVAIIKEEHAVDEGDLNSLEAEEGEEGDDVVEDLENDVEDGDAEDHGGANFEEEEH